MSRSPRRSVWMFRWPGAVSRCRRLAAESQGPGTGRISSVAEQQNRNLQGQVQLLHPAPLIIMKVSRHPARGTETLQGVLFMRLVLHSIAVAVVGFSFLSGLGVSGQEQKPAASIPETIPLLSGSNLTLPHTKE